MILINCVCVCVSVCARACMHEWVVVVVMAEVDSESVP